LSNITNLNRDYLIKINVKEATIDVPKMTFWNTDKKTSNMFVQLVINMSENELIKNYVTIENATDYKITLNVIKPKTNQYRTFEAKLLNEEKALFEIDLTSEFIDQVGNYNFEFEVSSKVENNDESITTSSSTYEVKGSILTNLNQEISSSPDLPILKQLIEQVKSLQGGDLTGYQKKSDNSLETTSKEIVGAINEVNSQYKDIAKKTIVEGNKIYLAKNDGTKLDEGTDLPTSSGSSEADDITIKDIDNNFTSTNVEGALSELFQSASNGKGLIATAITGKGVDASSSDTFAQLATKIQQISGSSIASDTALGKKMYSFAVISDIHYGRTDYSVPEDTNKMLEGLEGLNIDFVCGCGDLVVDTPNTRIPVFKQLWDSKCTKTLYSCTGNHDAKVTEGVWQQNIGHGFRYSFEKNGDAFIFMSVDNDVNITGTPADFYSESLDWLATKMQEYKGKRIFLFMHYPLYGYSGLKPKQVYGFASNSTESSTIAGYMSSIENLIIFSGHSPQPFNVEKLDPTYNNIKFYEINAHNSATIGMPSIGLPRNLDLSYITDTDPIEGMVVDVYEKGVIFRGYDFVNNDYMDEYTYYLQVKNNNAINIDASVEQISINESAYADFTVKLNREIENDVTVYLVNSNDYISLDKSSLTFTSNNWSTPQTVRVTASHQAENYDTLLSNITLSCEGANSKNITVTVNNIDVPPVTYYSISKTLTGCTLSNSATQVEENTSYSATINLNDNYQLQSLTVTMGDTDITSTAVSGTNISIANVTGNIVITALATYVEVEGTNILPVFANWTNDTVAPNAISNSNSLSATFTFTAKSQGIRYDIPTDVISANQGKKLIFRADEITLNDGVTNVGIDLKHATGDVVSMTINPNIGEMTISDTKVYQIRIRVKSSVTGLPATLKITNLRAWIK
jgi:hypothetical protein